MEDTIADTLKKMEENIKNCEILYHILGMKLQSRDTDREHYMIKGYSEDEIDVAEDIVDLYLELIYLVENSKVVL